MASRSTAGLAVAATTENMMEKTCMNCGRSACDHKDAMRCSNGNALWVPDTKAFKQLEEENALLRELASVAADKVIELAGMTANAEVTGQASAACEGPR